MSPLIGFFLNRSFVVNMISAFIILAGLILGSMIKRDVIPPFEYKSVGIRVSLPGASATEVEKFLAYPIENALQGLPHAKEMTTDSTSGRLRIRIYFDAGHKTMMESVEQIRSRINGISWQLPGQARDIEVEQDKVSEVFFLGIALEGFDQSEPEHRRLARQLEDRIEAVPGVVEVDLDMNPQNVYIDLDAKKIAQNEISIAEIRQRVEQALNFSPIGKVDDDEKTVTIEVDRPAEALASLENLAIRSNRTGDTLLLKDLAKISLKIDEIKKWDRFNGAPAIKMYSRKDIISDSLDLKKEVTQILDKFNQDLPEGLKASVFLDAPRFIAKQLETLKYNGLVGMIIVLVILTLFFNWKVSIATSFGIPIAYCGTLVALYMLNISIDLISVVGMILVLGILVDDAIIIAERYMENLEKGLEPKQAAFAASRDLMLPVTGTVLTTIFAFAPMVLVASEIAIVFYAIPVVIITSLVMSWLESFFILPNHLQHFIDKPAKPNHSASWFGRTLSLYKALLRRILVFRYGVMVLLLVFLGVSGWVAKNKIQKSFYFNPSNERIAVNIMLKENRSLAHTEKLIKPIENYLMTLPKDLFPHLSTSIGDLWTHGRYYEGFRYAKLFVNISEEVSHPNELKKKYTKIIDEEVKKLITDEFESVTVGKEQNDQDEQKKDLLTISISGHEEVDYLQLKGSIEDRIKQDQLALSMVKEVNEFDNKWVFVPDTEKLARHQLSLNLITEQLRSFFVPHELMQIRLQGETRWIYTQVEQAKPLSKTLLENLSIANNLGLPVPLKMLGQWEERRQLATIQHKNGKRQFAFDLAFTPSETMNVTLAKEQAQKITEDLKTKYPSYQIELQDGDRAEANSRTWALKVALLCIALVLFTLALILGSVSLPFIVGLPIPFGLMGIVWALYLHDMPMGMMSLVGLLGTVGVSVNDSLIMVDQILQRGKNEAIISRDSIIEGAASRLRAIILTTVTTLGGVFPMAYGIGGESGFTQPLAFSLGWGLFFSTFLTLFALPAFIEIRYDISRAWVWLRGRDSVIIADTHQPSTELPQKIARSEAPIFEDRKYPPPPPL